LLQKKISTQRRNKIFACFCEGITATAAARLAGANRNTVNYYFNRIRKILLLESLQEGGVEAGEFELDESDFGAKRVRGKRGRGAAGKAPVFGLLKRGGKVFVKIVKNCSKEELLPVIQGKILEKSVVYTDGWRAYDGLILNGYEHYRVFHSEDEFARGRPHVDGIENFRSFAKRRLAKFNGCASDKFLIRLKESEFRYNHRNEDLLPAIKKLFKISEKS
jgi:transposase-like protein